MSVSWQGECWDCGWASHEAGSRFDAVGRPPLQRTFIPCLPGAMRAVPLWGFSRFIRGCTADRGIRHSPFGTRYSPDPGAPGRRALPHTHENTFVAGRDRQDRRFDPRERER